MQGFSLETNPFFVLGVSPRSRLREIEDAFEDAVIASPDNEQSLLKSKQQLLTPNARLAAELAWLPDLAPRRADDLIRDLRASNKARILTSLSELPALSAANLAADAAERFVDHQFILPMIDAHSRSMSDSVFSLLNSTRLASGFARIERSQFDDAVRDIQKRHANAALRSITAHKQPPSVLTSIIESCPDQHDTTLRELVREYDHWSGPFLGQIEQDIEKVLAAVVGGGADELIQLSNLLQAWDELSQPVQVYSQKSGLDEERTLKIYRKVRGKCVELANDHQRFDDARFLTQVMQELFQELPTAAAELHQDAATLQDLSSDLKLQKALAPLTSAIDAAQQNIPATLANLKRNKFEEHPAGTVLKALYDAFIECNARLAGGALSDAAIKTLRSFALDLNNKHDDPFASKALLEGIQRAAKPRDAELSHLLQKDMNTVSNNCDHNLLNDALAKESWTQAIELITRMLGRATDSERKAEFQQLLISIEQKRTSRNWKRFGWGIAAAVLLVAIMNENKPTSRTSYTPNEETSTVSGSNSNLNSGNDWSSQSSTPDDIEVEPPAGEGLTLSAGQVRYCVFEGERLKLLKPLVPDDNEKAVDSFNARVEDFNSRCSRFRYFKRDMQTANADVAQAESRLQSEVEQIANELSQ